MAVLSVILSSSIESVDDSVMVSDAANVESYDERDAAAVYAKGLLKMPVTSLSGCDVGHVKNFSFDPETKEIGLDVSVGIQALHIDMMVPWSKIESIDEVIEVSDSAVLHLCLAPLY